MLSVSFLNPALSPQFGSDLNVLGDTRLWKATKWGCVSSAREHGSLLTCELRVVSEESFIWLDSRQLLCQVQCDPIFLWDPLLRIPRGRQVAIAWKCFLRYRSFLSLFSPPTRYKCCCSITQPCLTLWPMDYSTPGLPVHHQLPEFTHTHVHWVGDAIKPSHPLSSPSPPTFNLSQHQALF